MFVVEHPLFGSFDPCPYRYGSYGCLPKSAHGINKDDLRVAARLVTCWVPHVEVLVISVQWEFQDPKMEVLYHIRPYFVGIIPYIALT
jgi:hypothetical protein